VTIALFIPNRLVGAEGQQMAADDAKHLYNVLWVHTKE
jgi:hypothetical protein